MQQLPTLFTLKFDRSQTLRNNSKQQAANNMQQGVQTDSASNNVGSGWPTMMCPFELGFK